MTSDDGKQWTKEKGWVDTPITTNTQTSGLPAWTNDYPCLSNYGTIKKTTDPKIVVNIENTDKHYFYQDKSFLYQYANNNRVKGTWNCVDGKLLIKTDDGEQWTEKDGWVKTQQQTQQRKKTFKNCPETFPIKKGCKNETIKKVQACLKMPKRYQTGNFGPITKEYLESRDLNGLLISQETYDKICGSSNVTSTSTGTQNTTTPTNSKTGYEDYTFDEVENDSTPTKTSTPTVQSNDSQPTDSQPKDNFYLKDIG
jgi:hypothetical protein